MSTVTADEIAGYHFHCKAVRAVFDPADGPFAVEEVPAALYRADRAARRRNDMHWAWTHQRYWGGYAKVSRAIHDTLAGLRLDPWVRALLSSAPAPPTLDVTETAVHVGDLQLDDVPGAARWPAAWALLHAPYLEDPQQLAHALAFARATAGTWATAAPPKRKRKRGRARGT